jgi:hypothetical protein
MRFSHVSALTGIVAVLFACNSTTVDLGGKSGTPTVVASGIQLTPSNLVSDGTNLYWLTSEGTGGPLLSMPVGGGAISTVVSAQLGGGFLAVDDTNVYFIDETGAVSRVPKGGGPSTPIIKLTDSGLTALGDRLYWREISPGTQASVIKTVPLKGGTVSTLADLPASVSGEALGVTKTTGFFGGFTSPGLYAFPLGSGGPVDGGSVPNLTGRCQFLISDTDAVYCGGYFGPTSGTAPAGSLIRVESSGSATVLGNILAGGGGIDAGAGGVAYDATDVYWADPITVGTIMKVSKTGGTPVTLAKDTNPVAVAVDDTAVYWSDVGGNIMRLAK